MGQAGIPMLNKVGYSMFWNSVWDSKIHYNRFLKEDIFLNQFFLLSFNDNSSLNTFNFKSKKKINNFKIKNHFIDNEKSSLYKFLLNLNRVDYYSSKLWILRFQKWIILYHFLYITNFNKLLIKKSNDLEFFNYYDNFYYFYNFYLKSGLKICNSFRFFKSNSKLI